jgi:hypothetical protein
MLVDEMEEVREIRARIKNFSNWLKTVDVE